MMRSIRSILLIVGVLLFTNTLIYAQVSDFSIEYGETRSATFDGSDTTQAWIFVGETGDLLTLRVYRIAGRFTPRLRLLDGTGGVLAESSGTTFNDYDELQLRTGLPATGPYQIEVQAQDIISNTVDNPAEYALTLESNGQLRSDPNEGLPPLPDVAPAPDLEAGESRFVGLLNIEAYGASPIDTRAAGTSDIPARFLVSNAEQTIAINNIDPVGQGVRSITLLPEGVGLTPRLNSRDVTVFSDETFTVAYDSNRFEYRFDFENGRTLLTDFYRVRSIVVREGIVAVAMTPDEDSPERSLLFDNPFIAIQRRGEGQAVDAINEIQLDDAPPIITDLAGFTHLAYLNGQLRVLYENGGRLLSDEVGWTLRADPEQSERYTNALALPTAIGTTRTLAFDLDWRGLADLQISENRLQVVALDGRRIEETLGNVRSVLTEEAAIRIEQQSDTFVTLLADGTRIEALRQPNDNPEALPHETGYVPRNSNLLGQSLQPPCACLGEFLNTEAINPANGNFHYAVNDFLIPSHSLGLEFTRHFNSQAPGNQTPEYMRNAPNGYLLGTVGEGWRHSYQYELDVRFAPSGDLRLILPDGSLHEFQQAGPRRFTSTTLRHWVIEQTDGLIGQWVATTTAGVRYYFDSAGRLQRISQANDLSVLIVPLPETQPYADRAARGAFIVEPYGRRLELYMAENGQIVTVRDTAIREVQYQYSTDRLSGVSYTALTDSAAYDYDESGLLIRIADARSPYHNQVALEYDDRRRIQSYTENPDGNLQRTLSYLYALDEDQNRLIRQRFTVNGALRETAWTYDERYLLTRYDTPQAGFTYEFTYTDDDLLADFRTPTLTRYRLQFDDRGNLTQFIDPFSSADQSYRFTYDTRANQSLLTEVRYPNSAADRFTYTDTVPAQVQSRTQLVSPGQERTTRYEYDQFGRRILVVEPGEIATLYRYDSFGYVSEIWQGIALATEERAVDITDSNRALRILTLEYDLTGQLRAFSNGRGSTYTLTWDNSTRLLRELSDPFGESLRFSYDNGVLTQVDDRGQITDYSYDGLGNIASVTDGLGNITTYTHDEAGNLLTVIDNLERTTQYSYSVLNEIVRVASPDGAVSTYSTTLDPEGDFVLHTQTDDAGRELLYRYDALGRLRNYSVREGDATLRDYRIEYNRGGWPVEVTEANTGRTTTVAYDFLGQIQTITTGGETTRFDYDARGLLSRVQTPAGRETRYTYDALGNLAEVLLPDETIYRYRYDEESNLISALDPLDLETTYVYNTLGQLVSVLDPLGNEESYLYDVRGNLTSITDPRGNARNFEYDALGQLVLVSDGSNQETAFAYQSELLLEIDQPGVRSTRLTYDVNNRIIAVTESPGEQRSLYSYTPLDQVSRISDPLGHTTSYNYDPLGRLTTITDAVGNTQRFSWFAGALSQYEHEGLAYNLTADSLGRITSLIDRGTEQNVALNTFFAYDDDGLIESIETGTNSGIGSNRSVQQAFEYSLTGQPIRYVDAGGGEWVLEYDAAGRLLSVTNPRDVPTRYVYDDAGRIIQIDYYADTPQAATERFEYDANGNVIAYINPQGVRNTYQYDTNNNLLQATLAAGTELEQRLLFAYNGLGELVRTQDALGNETRYFYALGQLNRIERSLGDPALAIAVVYEYDDKGNLRNITMPPRRDAPEDVEDVFISITQTYDALDRRVRYVNGEDNVWAYTYDELDNITQISDPLGSVVTYSYDSYGRVEDIAYPISGMDVRLRYGITGNLERIFLPFNSSNNSQLLDYDTDAQGNVLSFQTGASLTRFEYDLMGNLVQRLGADGSTTSYNYDAANRLIRTEYDDGRVVERSYDELGRPIQIGDLGYRYDVLGRVQAQTASTGDVSYSYDANGNRIERDAGQLGRTVTDYDGLGRPVRITLGTESVDLLYNNVSQIVQINRSNGVETNIDYDAAGRILRVLHIGPDGSRLDGFNYEYDAVGNLIRADRITNGWSILYAYDVAHRLIDERWLNDNGETIYNANFRYDNAGNRVVEVRDGQETQYTYSNNNLLLSATRSRSSIRLGSGLPLGFLLLGSGGWLLRRRKKIWLLGILLVGGSIAFAAPPRQVIGLGDVRYEYDATGNVVEIIYRVAGNDFPLALSYDAENRLVAVSGFNELGQSVDTRLEYDELSRLVRWQATDERDYRLFWDGDELIGMQNLADPDAAPSQFLSLDGQRLLTLDTNGDALWHLNDQIGGTRRYADEAGQLLAEPQRQLDYGSFGVRIFPQADPNATEGAAAVDVPTPFFAGNLYDPSTGLYILGLRGYDPLSGRFLQPDPIRQDPVGTLYTYARNRPFVFNDPSGTTAEPFLEPLERIASLQQLQPETLIPQPRVPESIPALITPQLQSQDVLRVMDMVETLRYGTNAVVGRLAPSFEEFALFTLNPISPEQLALDADPLRTVLTGFDGATVWHPNPTPDPFVPIDPVDNLLEVERLLAQANTQPFSWYPEWNYRQQTLPPTAAPSAFSSQNIAEAQFGHEVAPVLIAAGLPADVAYLTSLVQDLPAPQPVVPQVQSPFAPIEPVILDELDALRERTYNRVAPILPPAQQTCTDCIPPLSYGS